MNDAKAIRFDHSPSNFGNDYDFIEFLKKYKKQQMRNEEILRDLILPKLIFLNIDDYIGYLEMNEKIVHGVKN